MGCSTSMAEQRSSLESIGELSILLIIKTINSTATVIFGCYEVPAVEVHWSFRYLLLWRNAGQGPVGLQATVFSVLICTCCLHGSGMTIYARGMAQHSITCCMWPAESGAALSCVQVAKCQAHYFSGFGT
mmetsp:Transcript_17575/g.37956  ORF Transcript_17575/g.37956 Transcript_17575/m.37956 type:complete len:130 (+) Transcript_17575:1993-2382(+)